MPTSLNRQDKCISHRAETRKCRKRLAPYCQGMGLDCGYGGEAIVPWAICLDLEEPYTCVGRDPQHLWGQSLSNLPFRDDTLDFIFSSHLIEDFDYNEQRHIIREWVRVIKVGGHIVTYAPIEEVYRQHCDDTGQPYNKAHQNDNFCAATFAALSLPAHLLEIVHDAEYPEEYSFEVVARKV